MPSEKVLETKRKIVAELSQKIEESSVGIIADYKGINVEDDTALRKSLRESSVDYFVVKNTMLKRATSVAELFPFFGRTYRSCIK